MRLMMYNLKQTKNAQVKAICKATILISSPQLLYEQAKNCIHSINIGLIHVWSTNNNNEGELESMQMRKQCA